MIRAIYEFTEPLLEWKFLPSWLLMFATVFCFLMVGYEWRGFPWYIWGIATLCCQFLMIFYTALVDGRS